MTLNGETTKMEVVDLEKLWNFVGDNFFIWNLIWSQTACWWSGLGPKTRSKMSGFWAPMATKRAFFAWKIVWLVIV
jgi:hypothetical protein